VSPTPDSCERSDVSDDEHQAVKGASRARLRVVGRIQRSFGVSSIALTALFILAVFYGVYFMRSILLPIELEISRYLFTIRAINACLGLAVGTAVDLLGPRNSVHNIHGEMRPLSARCALSAKSVVPELILFGRRVPVDSHGAGGGRN
jgi:hypothetical protein